ncbi:MAG: hypothetical protein CSA35_04455 [Dethiosulfovibrio peptidovorans]|nr:MAG: hypothetical protein CSA35_04455 [Dethiosulfovibrio peptidovorans]
MTSADIETYLQRLLVRGAYTRRELERKLERRGCPVEVVCALLDTYESLGLVNDDAYAVLFVEGHPEWSRRRLQDDMRARGLSVDVIKRAMDDIVVDDDDRAMGLAMEWFDRGLSVRQIAGRLERRGFRRSSVLASLDQIDRPQEVSRRNE